MSSEANEFNQAINIWADVDQANGRPIDINVFVFDRAQQQQQQQE